MSRPRRTPIHVGLILGLVGLLALAACAGVDPDKPFGEVHDEIAARTGQDIVWLKDKEARAKAAEAVRTMLADGLGPDEALRIAYLNNLRFQAACARLGIAEAERVQAGLIANPRFSGAYLNNPSLGDKWEFELAENILTILFLPLRAKIGESGLEVAKAELAAAALDLALEVRDAYLAHLTARAEQKLLAQASEAGELSVLMTERYQAAGNATAFENWQRQALASEARLALAQAEVAEAATRERLNVLLGLFGPLAVWQPEAGTTIPPLPQDAGLPEHVESQAVAASYALAAGKADLTRTARRMGITNVESWLGELDVGFAGEREPGELPWLLGPSLAVEVPLFDQGQAKRAKARAMLAAVWDDYTATAIEVRAAARLAREQLRAAYAAAAYTEQVLTPQRQNVTTQAQLYYNAMDLSVFDLLEVKTREIAARRTSLRALRDYWAARARVDHILAGGSVAMNSLDLAPLASDPAAMGSAAAAGH